MFDGEDEEGNKRGIYIKRLGKRKYDYFILAKAFHGSRVMFKRNLDYYDENDPEMPEYGIRERLKAFKDSKRQVKTGTFFADIKMTEPGTEDYVEVDGVKRKRKFRDYK